MINLTDTYRNLRILLVRAGLLSLCIFSFIACESPADVDADRNIIRKYDPSLTGIRLKVDGQHSKYFGNYSKEIPELYSYGIENISGEKYEIKDILVEWQDSTIDNRALDISFPEVPFTLASSGSRSFFNIDLSFIDIELVNERSGSKNSRILVIGEIDTLVFDISYDVPPLVVDMPDLSNVKQNSNIPVNINLYNFSESNNGLLRPVIESEDDELKLFKPDDFPMLLDKNTVNTMQLLFNGKELGEYSYVIPLLYQKRFPGAPDEIEISINVVK